MITIQITALALALLLTGCSYNENRRPPTVMPPNHHVMSVDSGYSISQIQQQPQQQQQVSVKQPQDSVITDVPAPAGILGAVIAWGWARKLRKRIKEAGK